MCPDSQDIHTNIQSCIITAQTCILTAQTCILTIKTCILTLQTCMLTVHTCIPFRQACILNVKICILPVHTCIITIQTYIKAVQKCILTVQHGTICVRQSRNKCLKVTHIFLIKRISPSKMSTSFGAKTKAYSLRYAYAAAVSFPSCRPSRLLGIVWQND